MSAVAVVVAAIPCTRAVRVQGSWPSSADCIVESERCPAAASLGRPNMTTAWSSWHPGNRDTAEPGWAAVSVARHTGAGT